tara:strand:+ start:1034 stop:1570 length:537 start_codon:yes stop_codon:yes gene_type:complete
MLNELIAFIDLLLANPSLRQQVSSNQEGRGSLSNRSVINVQVVDLISRTGVQSVLLSWATMVVDTRELDPMSMKSTKETNALHTYRNILQTHNDWLADGEWWSDYYTEIKEPWTTLRRIVYGERRPPSPVYCPVQDCVGILRLEPNGDVHCLEDNTHKWVYDEWSRLAKLMLETSVQA